MGDSINSLWKLVTYSLLDNGGYVRLQWCLVGMMHNKIIGVYRLVLLVKGLLLWERCHGLLRLIMD